MSFIFIDRRQATSGKSTTNRQKFLRRIKESIKASNPKLLGNMDANPTNATKIVSTSLEEPRFVYGQSGTRNVVFIGNDKYLRGDDFDVSDIRSEGKCRGGGPGENGEDDFIVNVSKDEFLDYFFEDLELPFLEKTKDSKIVEMTQQRAGFTTSGAPANLSVVESFKRSKARRIALGAPYQRQINDITEEIEELEKELNPSLEILALIQELKEKRSALVVKKAAISMFDKIDLKYRNFAQKPLKTTDAVMICIMDISGSMGEHEKKVSRKFFALLYAFLRRKYKDIDVIFIAHTEEAVELSENEFFTTRVNGGTVVSSALTLARKIIRERYSLNSTNLYICQASDGDNWEDDRNQTIEELESPGALLDMVQFYSYIEVRGNSFYSSESELWRVYEDVLERNDNFLISKIFNEDGVYDAFKEMFKKRNKA